MRTVMPARIPPSAACRPRRADAPTRRESNSPGEEFTSDPLAYWVDTTLYCLEQSTVTVPFSVILSPRM